jgi:hypothetical protein
MTRFVFEGTDELGFLCPDGENAPFAVFDIAKQDWLIVTEDEVKARTIVALLARHRLMTMPAASRESSTR